jgi:uncharacterized phiE125 gp8 family phage protein
MSTVSIPQPVVTLAEAQAFVRIETGEEEAVLAGLIRTATALCEAFLNQAVIVRAFSEEVTAGAEWKRLSITPVRDIGLVEAIALDGTAEPLVTQAYAVDIDSSGDGWIRAAGSPLGRVRVAGTAGMAADTNQVPEPIRQGVLRLVAHLFSARDGDGGEPPAAVTALWRPYRRMRLA